MIKHFRHFEELREFFKDLEISSILLLKTKLTTFDGYLKSILLGESQWLYFFVTTPFLATCKANGKEYQVGQSFIANNCTATCTCSGQDRVGCVSLCPPALVICNQAEKKEQYRDYITDSKCFCNRERCVKGNYIIVL